jgi:hypothetical protein
MGEGGWLVLRGRTQRLDLGSRYASPVIRPLGLMPVATVVP